MDKTVAAVFVAFGLVVGSSAALAHEPAHHHPGSHGPSHDFAAGEPGDTRKPSRIVQIAMRETEDGKMLFNPADLSVRKGEQVKFAAQPRQGRT